MIDVLSTVRKLLRLAQSPNANEAASAAAKAQRLIDEHKLNAAMLEVDAGHGESPDEPIVNFATKGAPLYARGARDRWRWMLASTIMRANGCKGYQLGDAIQIIGRPSDVDTVRYLYGYLESEVERLDARDGQGCGRSWRNNYRLGVVDTIAAKLQQERQAFAEQARRQAEAAGGSTALVRVNQALAKIERRNDEVTQWVKKNLRLVNMGGGSTAYVESARQQGRKAGESIAINRARGALSGRRLEA